MRGGWPYRLVLAAAVGCHAPAPKPKPPPAPVVLPEADRALPPVDVSRVPADGPPPAPAGRVHPLTADDCLALACRNAPTADLIAAAAADGGAGSLCGSEAVADLRRVTAGHLAREVRNRSAGAALDLYYRLLEAEHLSDVLVASQAEVDALVATAETLAGQGFKEAGEAGQLRRQQGDLRADHARLRNGARRLNLELKSLLNLDGTPCPLLPCDRVVVLPDPLDPAHAVKVGLAARPDLQLLRDLAARVDAETVAAARRAVTGLVPPLAALAAASRVPTPGLRAAVPALAEPDVEAVRRQVLSLLADREREAAKEIRAAVDEWAGQRDLVAFSKRRVRLEADRVREVEARRAAGEGVEAAARQARLGHLQAEANVIREAVRWKQADVKARQAMGLLCGPRREGD